MTRHMKRSLVGYAVPFVDACRSLHQRVHGFVLARGRSVVKRRAPVEMLGVDLGAGIDEHVDGVKNKPHAERFVRQ